MARIFAIGTGPLLNAGSHRFSGQCLRTLHFVRPLLDAGHRIELVVHPISDVDFVAGRDPVAAPLEVDGLHYHQLASNTDSLILPYLQERLDRFDPDAVLGINPFPSSLACRLRTNQPIWCDLNGYAMVEAQTRAHVYDDDGCLARFARQEKATVRRADRFSTVSTPQKHALLGELALMGRLNKHTFNHPFVSVVPNAIADHYRQLGQRPRHPDPERCRVLWCGAYNTWTDVDLLFDVMTEAMNQIPHLTFVSTGGTISGHDERTYLRFQDKVRASPLRDRFDLKGWVAREEVDDLLMSCDMGINIDGQNYETLFGARNRITTMLACGLPVVSTLGSEITHELAAQSLGLFAAIGDRSGLVRALVEGADNPEDTRQLGQRGRTFALEHYSCETTIRDCLTWMASPTQAPDHAARLLDTPDTGVMLQQRPLNEIESDQAALDETPLVELLADHRDLAIIRNRRLYRMAQWARRFFGGCGAQRGKRD